MAILKLILNADRGHVICDRCEIAETSLTRLRGLLGRNGLLPGEGLLMRPAPAVHTCFMRFPIDVVFLDGRLGVLRIVEGVKPWRAVGHRGAEAVLELPAGSSKKHGIRHGDLLSVVEPRSVDGKRSRRQMATMNPHADGATAERPTDAIGQLREVLARPVLTLGIAAVVGAVLGREGLDGRGLLDAFFLATLVVLAAIDLERRILPNWLVLPSTGIVLVAQVALSPAEAVRAAVGALAAFLLLLVPALVRAGALGMGDVKLGLLLGAGLGGSVLSGLLIGLLAVVPVALYLLARHGGAARTTALPLGPFLAFGAAVVVLAGTPTL